MVIADTDIRGSAAAFRVEGRGGLVDLLTLLDGPPFDIFRNGDMTPDRIGTGSVALVTEFSTQLGPRDSPPTLEELGLTARAVVTGFASDTLVPGRALAAERLNLGLVPGMLTVSGPAEIAGVPVTGTWRRPLGPDADRASVLEARAVLDRAGLAALGVNLPETLLQGQGAADIRLDLPDGAPGRLTAETDLAGLALSVPELGWRMGPEATGRLEAEITLGPAPEVTLLRLEGPGLQHGRAGAIRPEGGGLDRLAVSRLRVGGPGSTWRGAGRARAGRCRRGSRSTAGACRWPMPRRWAAAAGRARRCRSRAGSTGWSSAPTSP
jgi:hypothetical protein